MEMSELTEENKEVVPESQIIDNVDFSVCDVCGEDHETEECPILSAGKKVVDAAAPSRARLTLPQSLQVKDFVDGSTSIITNELITEATQFGPLDAKRVEELDVETTRFPLKIFKPDGTFVYVDTTDEWQCNWMVLVAPANTAEEMNLIAYQRKEDIYFSAIKTIKPGKELRVWYGPHYGRKMAIPAAWEAGGESRAASMATTQGETESNRPTEASGRTLRGVKRRRKLKCRAHKRTRYDSDDEIYDDYKFHQSHNDVLKRLNPRQLGFKDIREWKCSRCGEMFENCLDFAHHLSDHYKPRQPGAKRRDAGVKRPKKFPCTLCGQKFTSEKLLHRHRSRNHKRALRELRKSQRALKNESKNCTEQKSPTENIDGSVTPSVNEESLQQENQQLTEQVSKAHEEPEAETIAAIRAALVASGAYESGENVPEEATAEECLDGNDKKESESADVDYGKVESFGEGEEENDEFSTAANEESSEDNSRHPEDESTESQSYERMGRRKGPHKCDICHKCFDKSIYLYRHIRKHTGDFTCLKCYKVFARKESMLKHQCPGPSELGSEQTSEFVCTYCNKSFGREHLLKRHVMKHTGEFTCDLCGKSYTSKETLMDHSCPKYPEMERYSCDICLKTFTKLKYLDKHIPVHTGTFSCAICGKWLRSNDSLTNHMRICGLVKELEANGTAICPHCKQEFDDLKTFRRHMYDHTHMFACESCNARFRNKLTLGLHVCDAERTMTCTECGKECNSIANLNRHRETHGEPQFSCDVCGRSYYREEALLKHPCERAKRTRSGRSTSYRKPPSLMPLICEMCGSMFSSTSSLNVHKNLHGEKKFACEVCGKRFHRKDLLLEHMAVHGQPEIPCPVCNKMFKTKKSLDVHLVLHGGVKRFTCQTCGKMFHQKGNLQKHEETHTPGRKHICSHCNKSFSSKEYLTIHVLEHTRGRIFSCHMCGRSFVKAHQLKAHRRIFHGNQAYVCKFCGLSVKLRHSLKRHLEKKHGNVRQEWESNEQIASMLMQRMVYEETEEDLMAMEAQKTIVTEVSLTQGAEVLLAVAGIGNAALQQAIADGAYRIQQGPSPKTIEISIESDDFQQSMYPQVSVEDGNMVDGEENQTIIQHVVTADGNMLPTQEDIQIAVGDPNEVNAQEITVMEDEEQTLTDGNTIILENGTVLQSAGNPDNPTDLVLYVLTTSEATETMQE